jgi:ubiquitin-conjugating enzyme (huntingtin interacting protein 2)
VQTIKTVLLSLRMLLEFPNPKDPQDAEVAKMMLEHPEDYAQKAQAWAVKYAGAPRQELDLSKYKKEITEEQPKTMAERYVGHHTPQNSPFRCLLVWTAGRLWWLI